MLRLGRQMRKALWFIRQVNGWHSYDKRDGAAVKAIQSLASHNLVEVNEFFQFRITEAGRIYWAKFALESVG